MDAKECRELVPALSLSRNITYPVYGGIYSPPGGVLRHDAVMWALARGACQHGAHIHQGVEVTSIDVVDNKVQGIVTSKGRIKTKKVIVAGGAYSVPLAHMVGIKLPVHPLTIQAMVTQPLKPFLNLALSSGAYDISGGHPKLRPINHKFILKSITFLRFNSKIKNCICFEFVLQNE